MAIRHSTPNQALILHSETQSMHFPTNLTSEEGGMETPEGAPGRDPIESCIRATHYALRDTQNELCIDESFFTVEDGTLWPTPCRPQHGQLASQPASSEARKEHHDILPQPITASTNAVAHHVLGGWHTLAHHRIDKQPNCPHRIALRNTRYAKC